MAGIRSIGWWVPPGRRWAHAIADECGIAPESVVRLGLASKAVAGDGDHPSTMGARATWCALRAAGLGVDDLDCLLFAGVTRDWPAPWVAAFGVLHELGATRAAGLDVANRCAAGIDALWLARALIESGTYRTVAVCCADRYDHLLGPPRPAEQVTDAAYAAGAATAIVSSIADNEMVAYSHFTNPDLSVHAGGGPLAGGTRRPVDDSAVEDHLHLWRTRLSMGELDLVARYSADADRHNYARIREQAGFDEIDFVACSPVVPAPQLAVLAELGVDLDATLFTIPQLGHIGPADLFLILGVAISAGRRVGRRIVMSTRTPVYSCALAILGDGEGPGIDVAGEGIDVALWKGAST